MILRTRFPNFWNNSIVFSGAIVPIKVLVLRVFSQYIS